MSGRKQHYIPQVLLKGFSSDPEAKSPQIFVYSRQRGVYKTNTRDTAAEREFYSPIIEGERTLDDSITEYEGELAQSLAILKQSLSVPAESSMAASVVAHLAIRNHHTRQTFEQAGTQMIRAIGDRMQDTSWVRKEMGFDKPFAQSAMKQGIRRMLQQKFPLLSATALQQMEAMALPIISASFDKFHKSQMGEITRLTDHLQDSMGEMVKDSHAKALGKSLAPEPRIEKLSCLKWTVTSARAVLPDCVTIGVSADGNAVPYILSNDEDLQMVFMPLAKDLVLLGVTGSGLPLSLARMEEWCAGCSADFFIASERCEGLAQLTKLIGTRSKELVTDLVNNAAGRSKLGK